MVSGRTASKRLDKVAGIHKYWARKPWRVLDDLILEHSKHGDTVLDPFMGSGAVGLQAILNGRNFCGSDLNPVALAISDATLAVNFDLNEFRLSFAQLENVVKRSIMENYRIGERFVLWSLVDDRGGLGCLSGYDFEDKKHDRFAPQDFADIKSRGFTFPDREFPKNFYKDRFSYKGINLVSEMFTQRNLNSLAQLRLAIEELDSPHKDLLLLALSNTLLHVSKLKGLNMRPLGVNNYWIPPDSVEENVWWRFADRVNKLGDAKNAIFEEAKSRGGSLGDYSLRKADSTDLSHLDDGSIDYILTDPPYGDAIQYSELSYIWNTWLEDSYDAEREVIVNPKQNKDVDSYVSMMERSLSEMKRVLAPQGKLTLAFHSKNLALWLALVQSLAQLGFRLLDIRTHNPKGNPFTRNWAKFSPKTDFYLTLDKQGVRPPEVVVPYQSALGVIRESLPRNLSVGDTYDHLVTRLAQFVLVNGWRVTDLPKSSSMKKSLEEFLGN